MTFGLWHGSHSFTEVQAQALAFMNLKNDLTWAQQTAAIKTKHSFIPFLKFLTLWLQARYMSVQKTCHKKMKYMYVYMYIYRGYYAVARRYEFCVRVTRTISQEWAKRTREILFLPREHKIHIFEPMCNVLFIIWRNQFNKSKRRESWLHWTIRHSQRWHMENTPLGSRMKWRMESASGLVPSKTLFSI